MPKLALYPGPILVLDESEETVEETVVEVTEEAKILIRDFNHKFSPSSDPKFLEE